MMKHNSDKTKFVKKILIDDRRGRVNFLLKLTQTNW